jgi:5'-deoxynucleotidase YfbR-like HD superfamily hydrolase
MGQFLRLLEMTQKLQQVIRRASVPGRIGYENDVEHSFHLAFAAIYLMNSYPKAFVGFDPYKVVTYALFHDLVEVHAGDYAYGACRDDKGRKEAEAAELIADAFPEFRDLRAWLRDYLALADKESRFIKGLDKVVATAIIYQSGGVSWREGCQTRDFIFDMLDNKLTEAGEAPLVGGMMKILKEQIVASGVRFAEADPAA